MLDKIQNEMFVAFVREYLRDQWELLGLRYGYARLKPRNAAKKMGAALFA